MATAPKARSNLQMENVDDDNHGQDRGSDRSEMDADAVIEELSAEEQVELDRMRTGEVDGGADAGGDEGDGGGDGDDEADADADGVDNDRDAAAAGDRDQGAGDDRGQRQEGERRPPKTINYGRHQRELSKRDQRLTELETLLGTERTARQTAEERSTRLDERTRMLLDAINSRPKVEEQQQQQQEDQDPEPDKDGDPIGWGEWRVRGLERTVDELRTGFTRDREQRQQETAEQRELRDFTSTIERAAQGNPDFADAFMHLRESRYFELGDIYAGIDVNDPAECAKLTRAEQAALSDQIQASFAQEQALVFRESKRTGRPIEQTIMRLAKARGFVPKQREQQQERQDDQQQGRRQEQQQERRPPADGGARREAPLRRAPPQRQSVSDEIDTIREAAGASRSLSDAGGSPGGDIDLKRLAEMDDDEFADLYSSIPKGKFDRLMGK